MVTGSGAVPQRRTSGRICAKSHAKFAPIGTFRLPGCAKIGKATKPCTTHTNRRKKIPDPLPTLKDPNKEEAQCWYHCASSLLRLHQNNPSALICESAFCAACAVPTR